MTTSFRTTTDASSIYRERTAVDIARPTSASDTGNLAAVTKNSTFQCGTIGPSLVAERPQERSTASTLP